jgi:hypothetical protein
MGYRDDYQYGRQFIPDIKKVLAEYLVKEAPEEEDQQRNTDLIVLKLEAIRVGCRIRRAVGANGINYLQRYSDEFTIRVERPRNSKTELRKIIEGWGDLFFYGFGDPDSGSLAAWILGDLNVFRSWHTDYLISKKQLPGIEKPNLDGTKFRAYKINELPKDKAEPFVIARQQPPHGLRRVL